MPLYRVIVHGTISPRTDVVGFYTARWCWGDDPHSAGARMLRRLAKEWDKDYATQLGAIVEFQIEECVEIGIREVSLVPNRGYTFYSKGEKKGDAA